jgi:hypothetical protein
VRRWPRWSAEPSRRRALLLWPAAAVVGIAAELHLYGWADPRDWAPDLLTGWTMIACGLTGWRRRPQSRSGALLAAAGFAWFAPNFAASGVAAVAWLSAHALYLYRGPFVQLVLTYPTGRATRHLDRAAVAVGYAAAVITPVWAYEAATIVLACLLAGAAVRGYAIAAGRERRMRLAALQATTVFAAVLVAVAVVRLAGPAQAASTVTLHAYQLALCGVSAGLLAGLWRWPWDRAEVADLVVELGHDRSGTLRDQLARALGDPRLRVGYWVPESAGFVDSGGHPVRVPDPGSGRSATVVERDGQPLAVLVHDPAVLGDPGLVEAVSSAAGLAAANARLQAQVRAQLAEISASRRRLLAAGDEERSRLERRLWEGALRRLGNVAAALGRARGPAAGMTPPNGSPGRRTSSHGWRTSCAGSAAGSIPGSWPRMGWRPRSPRWPTTSRSECSWRCRRAVQHRPRRRARTSFARKRSRTRRSTRLPRRSRCRSARIPAASGSKLRTTAPAAPTQLGARGCEGWLTGSRRSAGRLPWTARQAAGLGWWR